MGKGYEVGGHCMFEKQQGITGGKGHFLQILWGFFICLFFYPLVQVLGVKGRRFYSSKSSLNLFSFLLWAPYLPPVYLVALSWPCAKHGIDHLGIFTPGRPGKRGETTPVFPRQQNNAPGWKAFLSGVTKHQVGEGELGKWLLKVRERR